MLLACSLAGLSIFPVLGNILAYLTGVPRRPAQIALFTLLVGFVVYGLGRRSVVDTLLGRTLLRRSVLPVALSAGLIGSLAAFGIANGHSPSSYAWLSAFMATLWLSGAAMQAVYPRSGTVDVPTPMPLVKGYEWFLAALTASIALLTYVFGPDEQGEAYMAFRGSSIQMGTCAAILCVLALATLRGWLKGFTLLCGTYLVMLSTARTGVLLFFALNAVVLVSEWLYGRHRDPGHSGVGILRHVVLLVGCVLLVTAPMALRSEYYPYLASTYVVPEKFRATTYKLAGLVGQRVHVWDELTIRFNRLSRVVPGEGSLKDAGQLQRSDARWGLLLDSVKRVIARPTGYWPREFDAVVGTSCGPEPCKYPHNLLLEIAFHFGWGPLVLLAVGLSSWLLKVVRTFTPSHPLAMRVAGVGFLGHLGFAQISGNLLDHAVALVFGLIWLALWAVPGGAAGRDIGKTAVWPIDPSGRRG